MAPCRIYRPAACCEVCPGAVGARLKTLVNQRFCLNLWTGCLTGGCRTRLICRQYAPAELERPADEPVLPAHFRFPKSMARHAVLRPCIVIALRSIRPDGPRRASRRGGETC